MKSRLLVFLISAFIPVVAVAADTKAVPAPAKPASSKVDPALEAEHTEEDIKRHRTMAAAHEAAAKCQESGRDESVCNAELGQGVPRNRLRQVLWDEAPGSNAPCDAGSSGGGEIVGSR